VTLVVSWIKIALLMFRVEYLIGASADNRSFYEQSEHRSNVVLRLKGMLLPVKHDSLHMIICLLLSAFWDNLMGACYYKLECVSPTPDDSI
jgi:hypothetical protein